MTGLPWPCGWLRTVVASEISAQSSAARIQSATNRTALSTAPMKAVTSAAPATGWRSSFKGGQWHAPNAAEDALCSVHVAAQRVATSCLNLDPLLRIGRLHPPCVSYL